ncbi:unnamed protein product, partial [Aphanomyces euteiches]
RQLANGTTAKVQTDTSIPKQTTNTIPISDRVKAKKNNVQFMDEDLGSSRISRYLDCAGLQDGPNKQQTPEKEGKHKIRQKEENKKTTQKSGRLHSNPRRNTPLEKKDRTILPWGFDLKEGEELGFFTEPKEGEGQHHQALLNAQIMNEDTVILADTGADMSVIHIRAVEWLKLPIDRRKTTRIDGLGSNSVRTIGTAPVKITLGQGIVYCLELDVCDLGDVGFNM